MMTGEQAETHGKRADSDAMAARAFAAFASEVRTQVEAGLTSLLDEAVARGRKQGADVEAVIEAVRSLSMRGGKRLRAVLLAAAYEGCGGEGGARAVTSAGVALELLQTYLLIHDDWMDGDDVRRGGPSVHAMLRARFAGVSVSASGAPLGDAAGILAGDHASALAQRAFFAVGLPAERVLEAAKLFARIQEEVILGQLLDLRGAGGTDGSVEAMHDLKTGSYTVRGPLLLGAVLAGAACVDARDSRDARDARDARDVESALVRFAAPLGVAFQLRDDLLGTFGDPRETGKPAGNDVRCGKQTALVAELMKEIAQRTDAGLEDSMRRAFGVRDASQADVDALVARMGGARARVEARLRELLALAQREVAAAPLTARGKLLLEGAVLALGERER